MKPTLYEVPVPILTPRLLLRPAQTGDGPALNEALHESVERLRPWMPWARGTLATVEESEENCRQAHAKFILREDLRFHMYGRESGRLVGSTGLHRFNFAGGIFEIGYWVRTSESARGYATEATHALTRYAFSALGARRVQLFCNAENIFSCAIPRRLGFLEEGRLRQYDTYVEPGASCRDSLVFSRISLEGLPALEVTWG